MHVKVGGNPWACLSVNFLWKQFLLQVGKYFVEFDENIGYIANAELTQKYPEDNVVQLTYEGAWRKDRNSLSSNGEIN